MTRVVGLRLGGAAAPEAAASFLAGFLEVNALVLVKSRHVVEALDAFLGGIAPERFRDTLPVLRRAFAGLGATERRYLLENVLNSPPPPPPADVPALDDAQVGVARSLREQTEAHRAVPLCASCHVKMDPLGFALENYDAIGQWRTEDGKLPLDVSGTLPGGRTFSGPNELKAILKDRMPAFAKSLSEMMLTYATGRGVEGYDRLVIRSLVDRMAKDEYRLQSLIQGIVKSVPFQQRRGEDTVAAQEARHP